MVDGCHLENRISAIGLGLYLKRRTVRLTQNLDGGNIIELAHFLVFGKPVFVVDLTMQDFLNIQKQQILM